MFSFFPSKKRFWGKKKIEQLWNAYKIANVKHKKVHQTGELFWESMF